MSERRFWQTSPFDVPLLRALSIRARREARQTVPDAGPPNSAEDGEPGLPGRIRLRRFAGPAAHVEQLSAAAAGRAPHRHPRRSHHADAGPAGRRRDDQRPAARPGGDLRRLRLPQPAVSGRAAEVIRLFQAPVIAVLGNHDYWSGAGEVGKALQHGGAEVLDNRTPPSPSAPSGCRWSASTTPTRATPQRDAAVRGLRNDLPAIGLSHIAEEADGLWRHGVPLVLSGHTHARTGDVGAASRAVGRQDGRPQLRPRSLRLARLKPAATASRRVRSTSGPGSARRWCRFASAIAAGAR